MLSTTKMSRHAIDEFKAIYQEEFGEMLSDEEATEMATHVLRLFYLLSKEPVDPSH